MRGSSTWRYAAAVGLVMLLASRADAATCGSGIKTCDCGDTVVGTYTLTSADPVTSTGTSDTCSTDIGLHLAASASLNGGSFFIRGSVTNPADIDAAGVVFDGCGATLSSVLVEGFHNGVTLQDRTCTSGTANQIANVTVTSNGDTTNHAGYGFKINNSDYVTLRGITVQNAADEGIHIGTGSDHVSLLTLNTGNCGTVGNTISDSFRENLYFRSSSSNTITSLTSSYPGGCGSGSSCAAAYIKSSSSNTITGSTFSDFRIVLTGNSDGNTIGSSSGAVAVKRIEIETSDEGAPDGNEFANVTATSTGGQACVAFTKDSDSSNTTPPSANHATSGLLKTCSNEVNAASALTGSLTTINDLCGFTCDDGTCGQNDPNNIVKFGSECP